MNRRYPPGIFESAYIHAVNANTGRLSLPQISGDWNGHGPGIDQGWSGPLVAAEGFVTVTGVVKLVMGNPNRDEDHRWVDRAYHSGSWAIRYSGPERRRLTGPRFIVEVAEHPEDSYRQRAVAEDWAPVLRTLARGDEIPLSAWQNIANQQR